jgi:hypothetical protein
MARLDQLGQAKELAQIGSVIGREFTRHGAGGAPDHPDIRWPAAAVRLRRP